MKLNNSAINMKNLKASISLKDALSKTNESHVEL